MESGSLLFAVILFVAGFNGLLAESSKLDEVIGAIEYDSAQTIASLIREGINMSLRFDSGKTSIHVAAEKDIVRFLINKNADVNIADKNGHSPLYAALKEGQKKTAATLIENDSSVDFDLGKWKAVIFRCVVENVKVENRKNKLIVKLIRKDVYTDTSPTDAFKEAVGKGDAHSTVRLIKNCNEEINAAVLHESLYNASQRGDAEFVKILIENGVDPNGAGPNGTLPLFVAVANGHDNVVDALVEGNVKINMKDQSGKTALHVAIDIGSKRMVEYLINNSANYNLKDDQGNSPLMLALRKGNEELALLLIENRADFYVLKESWGQAFFGSFTRNASSNVINALANKGVQIEPNWQDSLRRAVENGDVKGTEVLIKIYTKSMEDLKDLYLLHLASIKDHKDTAILLIKHGADVNAKNGVEKTPIELAVLYGHVDVARLLIERGAEIDVKNTNGWTMLHVAVIHGEVDVARLLIELGANVNAEDNNGC